MPVADAALGQVVGRNLDGHFIAIGNLDEMLPHFPGNMRKKFMTILQLHHIHGGRKNFRYNAIHFYAIIFTHSIP